MFFVVDGNVRADLGKRIRRRSLMVVAMATVSSTKACSQTIKLQDGREVRLTKKRIGDQAMGNAWCRGRDAVCVVGGSSYPDHVSGTATRDHICLQVGLDT